MAAIKQLAAVTRSGTGKGAARSVRREARVPGVIYGGGDKPEPISVDFKDLNKHIYAGHFLTTIFELDIEGRKERVLPRDYQLDVVTDRPLHVDFLRIAEHAKVHVEVPIRFVGDDNSRGIKRGGVLNAVRHELELVCDAANIPDEIEIDLSGLDIGDSLHISQVRLPEGTESAISDRDFTIATIVAPSGMKADAEEGAAAPASPAEVPLVGEDQGDDAQES